MIYYQQGDLIIAVTSKVKGKKLKHKILAEGEATGHCHTVKTGDAELYEHEGTLYLKVNSETAEIGHQEHGTVTLPKGDYIVRRVREFDHYDNEVRNVRD